MSAQPHDPPLELRSDDELVEWFSRYRTATNAAERGLAVRAWHVLMARHYDRIVGWVTTFRFEDRTDVMVAAADREDVVQQALERCLSGLAENFNGTTAAEFRAALKSCVQYACMDHCRRAMRREMGLAGSLDETVTTVEGDQLGRFDEALARLSARIEDGRFHAVLDLDAIGRALAAVANEDMQAVIRLTAEGYGSKEIAAAIGKSVANVDQLRSRGMRELRRRLQEDD